MKNLCPPSLLAEPNENFNVHLETTPEGFLHLCHVLVVIKHNLILHFNSLAWTEANFEMWLQHRSSKISLDTWWSSIIIKWIISWGWTRLWELGTIFSYGIPSKLLNLCILILSQKMKRFLSSSHQSERSWVGRCSLPSAFVLCCKHPTTAWGEPPLQMSPVGWARQGSTWANELCEMISAQPTSGGLRAPRAVLISLVASWPSWQTVQQLGEQSTSLAAKTLWEVPQHFGKGWVKFKLQHLHSLS